MREILGEYGTLMICSVAGVALLACLGILMEEGGGIYQIAYNFFSSIGMAVLS